MSWLENDRRRWREVRWSARIDIALVTAAVIVGLIFVSVVAGHFGSRRGQIICDGNGHVTMKNNDIDLNFQMSTEEFYRRIEELCRTNSTQKYTMGDI